MTTTTDAHLIETLVHSETLVDGDFLKARRDTVRLPDGRSAEREYIVHPGSVVIIPLLDVAHVILVPPFRSPFARVSIGSASFLDFVFLFFFFSFFSFSLLLFLFFFFFFF